MGALTEPHQGRDISSAILGHAASVGLIDDKRDRLLVSALVEEWLGSQNFSNHDFQAFWRLIGCDTSLILDIAERHWFDRDGEGRIDEYIDKGFCNAFKWANVAGPLTERLVGWFSTYWLDPLQAEFGGQLPDDEAAHERRTQSEARFRQAMDEGLAERYGLTFSEVEPDSRAWGCARAVELLSWLPRAQLLNVYTAWAITRAIMGSRRQERTMAWNLRWFFETEHDGDGEFAPQKIIERAHNLLQSGGPIGREAGRYLLEIGRAHV